MTKATSSKRARGGLRSGLSLGAGLLLVAAAWYLFAPVQLGGSFTYFQIVGDSMEPTISRGDLVLLRSQERYTTGDMVAYRDPDLGTVLHRIREVDGTVFILRGDNRDSDDSYRPVEEEIVGQVWQIVPGAGDAMRGLQSPAGNVLLGGATLALGAISIGRRAPRGPRARRSEGKVRRQGTAPGTAGSLADRSPAGNLLLSAAGVTLVAALVTGALVIANPAEHRVTRDFSYEHMGAFSYTGIAGRGVYDGDEVSTGDPVFVSMTRAVPVAFDYSVQPINGKATIERPAGRLRLDAVIAQDNGWQRTLPLTDWTPFVGANARITGELDLMELLALTRVMEELSGLFYPTYRVDVIATVRSSGVIAEGPFEDEYRTEMGFLLSNQQLMPAQGFEAESMDAVTVGRAVLEPWSVDVPVIGVTVSWPTMRALAIGLGVVTLGLVGVVLGSTALAARQGEVALIAARYGAYIVDATATEVTFAGRRVEVRRIEDLVKMARQDGLFIVHEHTDTVDELDRIQRRDRYHLVLPDVTYTYTSGAPAAVAGFPR